MDELFAEWRASELHRDCRIFVKDGIIDPQLWKGAPVKIVFLLKEANESKTQGPEGDLAEWVRNGMRQRPKGKMWWNLSRWAYCILGLARGDDLDFPDHDGKPEVESVLGEALCSTAVVNIKKSDGGSSSNDEDLIHYITKDWRYLERQLQIISPDIVVCGSTWHLVSAHLGQVERLRTHLYKTTRFYMVDFWHPSNRHAGDLDYFALYGMVKSSRILPTTPRTVP
jgi:hypothetical protein